MQQSQPSQKPETNKIDINDPDQVEALHQQFPEKHHSQIVDAIKVAGPEREKILRYLNGKA